MLNFHTFPFKMKSIGNLTKLSSLEISFNGLCCGFPHIETGPQMNFAMKDILDDYF